MELIHAECPGRVVLIDLPAFRFQEFIFQNNGADSQIPLKNFLRDKVFAHSGLPEDIVEEFLKKIEGLYPKFGNNVNTLIHEVHTCYKNFVIDLFNRNDEYLANAVMLMDFTRFEGSDLHCASHIILCQTSIDNRSAQSYDSGFYRKPVTLDNLYIDPLTLEQFVGRIFRIGQPSEAKITIFAEVPEDYKLFNEIYNDSEGLDIFGEGKNEIGFVIPVVIEKWNRILKENKEYSRNPGNFYSLDSFVGIYRTLYKMSDSKTLLNQFKESIREVCAKLAITKKED